MIDKIVSKPIKTAKKQAVSTLSKLLNEQKQYQPGSREYVLYQKRIESFTKGNSLAEQIDHIMNADKYK
jgi:hypothetical protein